MNKTLKQSTMMSGFAGLPFGVISQCMEGEIGVLGVPSEVEKGPRFGTSLAPDALRGMADRIGVDLQRSGRDLGNVDLSIGWYEVLRQLVTQVVNRNALPVVLGGSFDVAKVVLGALPDLPVVAATPLAQPDFAARSANTVWLGLNGSQPNEVWEEINQRKMCWCTARQLDEGGTNIQHQPDQATLWLDMSVVDLGHAAGVIGLNPGGMKPETLVSVIGSMTCSWKAIVITGLAPTCDTRGISELAAIETLNAALQNGRSGADAI